MIFGSPRLLIESHAKSHSPKDALSEFPKTYLTQGGGA